MRKANWMLSVMAAASAVMSLEAVRSISISMWNIIRPTLPAAANDDMCGLRSIMLRHGNLYNT